MRKTNSWVASISILSAVLFSLGVSTQSFAMNLEECASHYDHKARSLEKFLWTSFAGMGGGAAAGLAVGSIGTAGVATAAAWSYSFMTAAKQERHFELSHVLFFIDPDAQAADDDEEMEWRNSFYTFQWRVNKKLKDDEKLDYEEFTKMLTGLVKTGAICNSQRVIITNKKGVKKEKYQGWIMKPKKVYKMLRRMARARVEEEVQDG